MKHITQSERKYGEYFQTAADDKVQMPRLIWNAQVRSVRSLKLLDKVTLLNYKQVYNNDDDSSDDD